MQFIGEIFVWLITGYLAITGQLAESVLAIVPHEQTQHTAQQTQPSGDPTRLQRIASEYGSGSLPDILLQNAEYQRAATSDAVSQSEVNDTPVEDALVNIYCTYKNDGKIRTNTGTGFFIDPAGVIMTNAHVAQFLLLEKAEEGETECIIRAGNPAQALYRAELLYISPAWIERHAELISVAQPRGTGERDYALLFVTAGLDTKPMPGRFPYLSFDTTPLTHRTVGADVIVAGYPADGIDVGDPDALLRPVVAETTVTDMFTFGDNHADVLALDNSPVGAFGASGGPVLTKDRKVIGLISTKGLDGPTSLRAISLPYINRTIVEEGASDLEHIISGKLLLRSVLFTKIIAPFLTQILEAEL